MAIGGVFWMVFSMIIFRSTRAAPAEPTKKDAIPKRGAFSGSVPSIPCISLDLHKDVGTMGLYVMNQVTEGPARVNHKGGDLSGPGGKHCPNWSTARLYFYLRQGVKFHDGTEFKADMSSIHSTACWTPNGAGQVGRGQRFYRRVTIIDDYKVRIKMSSPGSDFLSRWLYDKLFNIHPSNGNPSVKITEQRHPCDRNRSL